MIYLLDYTEIGGPAGRYTDGSANRFLVINCNYLIIQLAAC